MLKLITKVVFFLFGVVLLLSLIEFNNKEIRQNSVKANSNFVKFIDQNNLVNSSFIESNSNKLIFLLNFTDFNCPLCFEDFNKLNEILQILLSEKEAQNVLLILTSEEDQVKYSMKRIELWKKANNINFKTVFCKNSIFKDFNYNHPSSLVINSKKEIIFFQEIPMGLNKHKLLIKYFRR